jgi:hypothetical protein
VLTARGCACRMLRHCCCCCWRRTAAAAAAAAARRQAATAPPLPPPRACCRTRPWCAYCCSGQLPRLSTPLSRPVSSLACWRGLKVGAAVANGVRRPGERRRIATGGKCCWVWLLEANRRAMKHAPQARKKLAAHAGQEHVQWTTEACTRLQAHQARSPATSHCHRHTRLLPAAPNSCWRRPVTAVRLQFC